MVYKSLLERDIKLHFLQILTAGAVYPDRVSKTVNIRPPGGSPDIQQNGGPPERDVESSIQASHSKKFKMDKCGLPWETVETVHWFMYPGQSHFTMVVPFHDREYFNPFSSLSEGPQMSPEDVDPTVIPMMFTNMEGTRSYASGLRFYRPFFVQKVNT